jgi:hypothetical protein
MKLIRNDYGLNVLNGRLLQKFIDLFSNLNISSYIVFRK